MKKIFFLLFVGLPLLSGACTSYLVSRSASADGSTMISYAADSHIRYGELYFRAAAKHAPGSMLTLYDRGTNKPLGQIPQATETYRVVGMTNEFGVSIGETTFGGLPGLEDSTALIDYGSLMFLGLQRSKTAREALQVMVSLVDKYGYYSSGESFSIADGQEVWILEMIGKGVEMVYDKKSKQDVNRHKGAVWVAVRIPEGYISAHANQARIQQFALEAKNVKNAISSKNLHRLFDPQVEIVYAHDVIDFAREKGFFSGKNEDFSFSDTYNPITFSGARMCDARVWTFFNRYVDGMDQYWDYAQGKKLSQRLPLYVKPRRQLTPQDLMAAYRDHFENTELDMSKDIGAGPYACPYRFRPMNFSYNDKDYFHERTTATQQTAFVWIAQVRPQLPAEIGSIVWMGIDDAASTVFVPFYAAMLKAPNSYAEGNGDILTYSENAAFWTFNKVANYAYSRYGDMIVDIRKAQKEIEENFEKSIPIIDRNALDYWEKDPQKAREFLTKLGCELGDETVKSWNQLFHFLLVKYADGNVKNEENGQFLRTPYNYPIPPKHPELPDFWKKMIIDHTGEKFMVPTP